MKKCAYCGRENETAASHCRECGTRFETNSPSDPSIWSSFALFPRSGEEWTRSLALPLFIGCLAIFTWSFVQGFGHGGVWRYAGPYITNRLLPVLGVALLLICSLGKGLRKEFRVVALITAALCVLGGLVPQLAE
jgi:hypothetical protein